MAVPLCAHYRAHVQPQGWRGIECTAFVEAANHSAAARKIAAAVAALEYGSTVPSSSIRFSCLPMLHRPGSDNTASTDSRELRDIRHHLALEMACAYVTSSARTEEHD